MNIIKQLNYLAQSKWYWLSYMTAGLALLAAALFYQYVLEEPPCVTCIQVRLWIALFVFVCFAGFLWSRHRVINAITQLSVILIAGALIERSYLLLGTERTETH